MKSQPLTLYLPDTRGVEVSRYGQGNRKIGMNVYTYSRIAGRAGMGTCPGSTDECESICYVKRIVGPVYYNYKRNLTDSVPPIPQDAKLLRIHVSGDFNTVEYINSWHVQLTRRPDVRAWAYTRSWRVPALLPALEELRALPNLQLFASMDPSTSEMPPTGWRRAWIDRTWDAAILHPERKLETRLLYGLYGRSHLTGNPFEPYAAHITHAGCSQDNTTVLCDGTPSYICPEETGRKPDCESCRYCFDGRRNDVTFLEH